MAAMTLAELREAIDSIGGDSNLKVVILVGQTSDGKYQIVRVNADGELVIAA